MTGSRERTDVVLRQLGASDAPTAADAAILQHVVAIVGLRAARLVAANTAVLLERLADGDRADQLAAARTTSTTTTTPKGVDADVTVIAIDGSVYKHHPRLKNWLELHIGRAVPELKVSGGSARLKTAQDPVTNYAFHSHFSYRAPIPSPTVRTDAGRRWQRQGSRPGSRNCGPPATAQLNDSDEPDNLGNRETGKCNLAV